MDSKIIYFVGIGVILIAVILLLVYPKIFNECVQDSDCIAVPDGCCGCNYGGRNKAININELRNYNERIDIECKGVKCPAVISNHRTCNAKPRCTFGKCALS